MLVKLNDSFTNKLMFFFLGNQQIPSGTALSNADQTLIKFSHIFP